MIKNTIKKSCSYRDCFANTNTHPELTFFSFPKDALRADIWVKFGATQDIRSCTGTKYLCEKHFSIKYMCYSPRRKLLLQTAVPYPYDLTLIEENAEQEAEQEPEPVPEPEPESQPDTSMEPEDYEEHEIFFLENESDNVSLAMHDDVGYELTVEDIKPADKHKLNDGDSSLPEERMPKVQKLNSDTVPAAPQSGLVLKKVKFKPRAKPTVHVDDPISTDDAKPEPVKVNEAKNKALSIKMVQESSVKLPATSSSAAESVPRKQDTDDARKPDPKISEFIFNGEMYVQMPKEHYDQKVKRLEEKLRSYETTMQRMRAVLDEVDDG